MTIDHIASLITVNSRVAIALMLVLTAVLGAGVPMIDQSTSLDQFTSDTPESEAQDYVDENFSAGDSNTTTAQIVISDDNVLSKDSLVTVLNYQETLQSNETVNESLAENDSMQSVANLVATSALRDDRIDDLEDRQQELNNTQQDLEDALDTLAASPNASIREEFDAVNANSSLTLTEDDYQTFEDAAQQLRNETASPQANVTDGENITSAQNATVAGSSSTRVNATASQNETTGGNNTAVQSAYRNGTSSVLEDEYAQLQADRTDVRLEFDPSLASQREKLAGMNQSAIDDTVERVLSADGEAAGHALMFMPNDYDPGSTDANKTMLLVTQQTDGGSFAPTDAPDDIIDAELTMQDLADASDISVLVFGSGITSSEITDSMTDSILLVGPLAILFVLVVLTFAYRDFLDIALGLLGIGTVLAWTFGVMGWVGIDFNQPFIIVIVLLIGLSIDYAIHVVMRYREDHANEDATPTSAMQVALASVGVALLYVTATTAIGFLSNLSSPLSIFRQIGVVSAIGIVSTLFVFGVLVPALKVELDSLLEGLGVDRSKPAFGTNGGLVNRVLSVGATLAQRAPVAVIVLTLLVSAGGVYGATQVETSFEEDDFLAENPDDWMTNLPEPFAPGTYQASDGMDVLNDRFVRQDTEATILVNGNVTDPATLDRLGEAESNASDMAVTQTYSNGEPAITSTLTVMDRVAAENESFNATLAAADTDGDAIPDRNVEDVYDELYRVAPNDAEDVLYRTDDGTYEALTMVVSVSGSASGDTVTEQMRGVASDIEGDDVDATATGDVIINKLTADQLLETVLYGLIVALLTTFVFLTIAYRLTKGSASLGAVTVLPVAFTVTWVLGSMAALDIPFNIVTGLITSLTIGLGVDYSVHVGERFNQELETLGSVGDALHATVTGTGGALLSSATTTAAGFAVLTAALLPFLQAFGIITALTIVFAFIASVFVLPSLLALWARFTGDSDSDTEADAPGYSNAQSDVTDSSRPAANAQQTAPTLKGHGQSAPARDHAGAVVVRTLSDRFAQPTGETTVHLTVEEPVDRILVREDAPGSIDHVEEVSPEPVELAQWDGSLYVLWQCDTVDDVSASLTYTVTPTDTASDGDRLEFTGCATTAADETRIAGDDTITVVSDVFERVLARGAATDSDVQAAAQQLESASLSDEQFERICQVWLQSETAPGRHRTPLPGQQ